MNRRERRASGLPPPEDYRLHHRLADGHRRAGRLVEAERHYRRAAELMPGPETLANLGAVLLDLRRPAEALQSFQDALMFEPDLAAALYGLGCALAALQRPAAAAFARAVAVAPDFLRGHEGLVEAHLAAGAMTAACRSACAALLRVDSLTLRAAFLGTVMQAPEVPGARAVMLRALQERWRRPQDLAFAACTIVAAGGTVEVGDALLQALLPLAPVCHPAVEAALIVARRALLEAAVAAGALSDAELTLACGLAFQGWINEYAWACSAEEAALMEAAPVPPVVLAMYRPLSAAEATAAPSTIVAQQISQPAEEARLRALIPVLTPIEDAVSSQVRAQYEVHPYPRWTELGTVDEVGSYADWLARRFPGSAPLRSGPLEVLVAGCGTGQHPLELRQAFSDIDVLAIDLSLASLAYAARMRAALGLSQVSFGQADLLQVHRLGRRFDIVEASGVLHHLADIWAGWRALLGVLRPGGVMTVSLYTERGRADVRAARAWLAERLYPPTTAGIRDCRRDLIACPEAWAQRLAMSPDFASISGCRDLLFHVHESTVTLPQIAAFLQAEGLALLGVEAPLAVMRAFAAWHGGVGDLTAWDRFEADHPTCLAGMVHLWVQKP